MSIEAQGVAGRHPGSRRDGILGHVEMVGHSCNPGVTAPWVDESGVRQVAEAESEPPGSVRKWWCRASGNRSRPGARSGAPASAGRRRAGEGCDMVTLVVSRKSLVTPWRSLAAPGARPATPTRWLWPNARIAELGATSVSDEAIVASGPSAGPEWRWRSWSASHRPSPLWPGSATACERNERWRRGPTCRVGPTTPLPCSARAGRRGGGGHVHHPRQRDRDHRCHQRATADGCRRGPADRVAPWSLAGAPPDTWRCGRHLGAPAAPANLANSQPIPVRG